jgi:hypothetical protein
MVRAADLSYAFLRPPASAPARAEARTPSNWFDDAGLPGDLRITADPGAARGLSVEQHAQRVLQHLRGDADGAV